MRLNDLANKMTGPLEGGQCTQCGRPLSENRCRKVPAGEFCIQFGLKNDPAAILYPSRDPVIEKAEQDPQVVATALLESEAQQRFDEVSARFADAALKLNALRLEAKTDQGTFDPFNGGWRPTGRVRELSAQEPALSGKVEQLSLERDRLGDELIRARCTHRDALDNAYRAHGLGVMQTNLPASGQRTIPVY